MTWICAGWVKREVDAYAAAVLAKLGLEARLHKEVHTVLAWAKSKGVEVFPGERVHRGPSWSTPGARWGSTTTTWWPPSRATTAPTACSPEVHRPIPYAAGRSAKPSGRASANVAPFTPPFGDNAFDIAMLSEAFIPRRGSPQTAPSASARPR